jgi:hypothetical protein
LPTIWLPVVLAVCVLVALVVAKAVSDWFVVVSYEVAVELAVAVVVKSPRIEATVSRAVLAAVSKEVTVVVAVTVPSRLVAVCVAVDAE